MQLDTFHALSNLNPPRGTQASAPSPVRPRNRAPLSRSEALIRFPIGTRVIRPCIANNKTTIYLGKVYDVCPPFWRAHFDDNDWEQLTISEVKRGATNGGGLRSRRGQGSHRASAVSWGRNVRSYWRQIRTKQNKHGWPGTRV